MRVCELRIFGAMNDVRNGEAEAKAEFVIGKCAEESNGKNRPEKREKKKRKEKKKQ